MRDRTLAWCIIFLGALGLAFYCWKSGEAFPSASIDLEMPAAKIQTNAQEYAAQLGYGKANAIKATGFTFDDSAKTFLEYQLDLRRAFALMKDTIPVWYWTSRFCLPLSPEEMKVWVSPSGKLMAFEHTIEDDRALPSLDHDQALAKARKFIEDNVHQRLDHYKLVEDTPKTQPHRTDYSFIFEDTKDSFEGAKLRYVITISGSDITQYNHFLYVPEEWLRKFSKLRSYNEVLSSAAGVFYMALTTGSFFVLLWAFTAGMIRWRICLILALISAGLAGFDAVNGLPEANFEYVTTAPYDGFKLGLLTAALGGAFTAFVQTFALAAAAEAIYRKSYPHKLAIENIFTRAGLRCQSTFDGLLAGLGGFGVHLGWVVFFYLIGRQLGVWCPLDIENIETLGSYVPSFSALKVGWDASISEEFLYRVLGLSFAERLTKNFWTGNPGVNFWVANILQAAAWAFMHSNYAQEPPYARGVELTVVGLFYGFLLRRFGIIACVFSHNLLDSFLGLVPLLVSPLSSLKLSGIVSLVPFLIPISLSAFFTKRDGANQDAASLSNESLPQPARSGLSRVAETILPPGFIYAGLKPSLRWLLAVTIVIFACIQLGFFYPTVGSTSKLLITREEAIDIAAKALKERNLNATGYNTAAATLHSLDGAECQYNFEHLGLVKTNAVMNETQDILGWQVRFFRPSQQQEYMVTLTGDGSLYALGIVKPEKDAGLNEPKNEAEHEAETFINTYHKELLPFSLKDASVQERDKRTDYSFAFKVPKFKVGEAQFSAQVDWVDGQIVAYNNSWTLPDNWVFERNRTTLRQTVCTIILLACATVLAVALVFWAAGLIRVHAIPWRPAILIGAATAGLSLLKGLDDAPNFFWGYGTDTPMVSYLIAQVVGQLTGTITTMATTTVLAAFGLTAIRLLLPTTTLSAIIKTTISPGGSGERKSNINIWLDGILLGYTAAFVARGVDTLFGYLHTHVSPEVSLAPLTNASLLLNYKIPSLYVFCDAASKGVDTIFLTAVAVGVYFKYLRRFSFFALFVVAQAVINALPGRHVQDIALSASSNVLTGLLSFLFIVVAKENLLAYFLSSYAGTLLSALRMHIAHTGKAFTGDVMLLTAFLLAPLAYLCYRLLSRRYESMDEADEPEPEANR